MSFILQRQREVDSGSEKKFANTTPFVVSKAIKRYDFQSVLSNFLEVLLVVELSDLGGWIKIRTHGTALLKRKGSRHDSLNKIGTVYRYMGYRKNSFSRYIVKRLCLQNGVLHSGVRTEGGRHSSSLIFLLNFFTVLSSIKYTFIYYCIVQYKYFIAPKIISVIFKIF
jgi:hypothetical protein